MRPTLAPPTEALNDRLPGWLARKKHWTFDAAMAVLLPFAKVAILPLDKVAVPFDEVAILPLGPVTAGVARTREQCSRKGWPLCAPNN